MILHHKAKRIDNGEEIQGFLTKMWGQYHIMKDNDENTAYPVDEDTIEPCYAELEQGLVWTNVLFFRKISRRKKAVNLCGYCRKQRVK